MTDQQRSRIRVGSAPDSWGVWLPDDPRQMPWPRFLDEISAAGYEWLELGPYGYLPTEPSRLAEELEERGLRVSAGDVAGALHQQGAFDDVLAAGRSVAELTAALGGRYVVFLPETYRGIDPEGTTTDVTTLDDEAWKRLTQGVTELARILRDEHGVQLVFHSHADSHVESQGEIERFLAHTDPEHVSFCLDTGHVAYGGGDSVALIRRFPERIGYVHLKQVDPEVLRRVRADDLSFAQAVRNGVCVEPPNGVPAFPPVIEALLDLDVDLFAIVEQDLYPCAADVPLPIAQRTRTYLGRCGLGRHGAGSLPDVTSRSARPDPGAS